MNNVNIKKSLTFLLLMVLFMLNKFAVAQSISEYYVEQYTKDQGLPSNGVYNFVEDKNGFLWIFTDAGIVRWNGSSFKKLSEIQPSISINDRVYHHINKYGGYTIITSTNEKSFYIDSNSKIQPFKHMNEIFCPFNGIGINQNKLDKIINTLPKDKQIRIRFEVEEIKKKLEYTIGFKINDTLECITSPQYCLFITPTNIYSVSEPTNPHFDMLISNKIVRFYQNLDVSLIETNGIKKLPRKSLLAKGSDRYSPIHVVGYSNNNKAQYILFGRNLLKIKLVGVQLQFDTILNNIPADYRTLYVNEQQDAIVIGTHHNGFCVYKKKLLQVKKQSKKRDRNSIYSHLITDQYTITNQNVTRFIPDFKETVWRWGQVGAMEKLRDGNILVYVKGKLVLLNKYLKPIKNWDISNHIIHSIVETDDRIFFANFSLGWIDKRTLEIKEITSKGSSLPFWITSISKGDQANTILMLVNGRVCRLNTKNGQIKILFKNKFNSPRFLFYDFENSLYFVGDVEDGITVIDSNGAAMRLPLDGNKNILSAHYILKDKDKDYWIPTNNGLYVITQKCMQTFMQTKNINSITYAFIGRQMGIEDEEFNGGFVNCGHTFGDSLSFGSMSGLVQLDLSIKHKLIKNHNPVITEHLIVDDQHIAYNNKETVVLDPDYRSFKIEADFSDMQNKKSDIYYRIRGNNDTNWYVTNKGNIFINRLLPGIYAVELSDDKRLTAGSVQLNIKVMPYWYTETYFLVFVVICIVLIIYGIIHLRIEQVKGLEARKLDKQRMRLFSVIAHDLRSPVNIFSGVVETIEFLIKQKRFEDINKVQEELEKSAKSLQLMLKNLLHWSLNQQKLIQMRKEYINVRNTITTLMEIYQPLADFKKIKLILSQEPDIIITNSRLTFEMLLRNVLDNCVKYSKSNTIVTIQVTKNTGGFQMEFISISKLKVSSPDIRQLKDILENKKGNMEVTEEHGLGHIIISESIKQLKGNAQLNLELETNTLRLAIRIPIV